MTSKESLEKFKLLYENKCKSPNNIIGFDVCYITIKQDLDRLERLEKFIKILKRQNDGQTISQEDDELLKEVFKNKED